MRKIITLILVVAALVTQAEPKFEDLLAKAKSGDVEAMCGVSRCYSIGIGVLHNKDRAEEWMQKAASNGCVRAIGICHEKGYGTKEDPAEAMKWYRKAAEAGDAAAMDLLGKGYASGIIKDGDKDEDERCAEAVRWYRKAADAGNADAMIHLGGCYRAGRGVERNDALWFEWHRKAAETGDPVAMLLFGLQYTGYSNSHLSGVEREKWCRKAAAAGCGLFFLVDFYETGCNFGFERNPTEAVRWCRRLADMGVPSAMGDLGFFYFKGIGVERDVSQAVKYFRRGAELGNNLAQRNLGWLYLHGIGVERDKKRSTEWYETAAQTRLKSGGYRYADRLHDLSVGWRYEAALWCAKMVPKRDVEWSGTWYQKVLWSALSAQYNYMVIQEGKTICKKCRDVIACLVLLFITILLCVGWIVRLILWLVRRNACGTLDTEEKWKGAIYRKQNGADAERYRIETRWWRLYSIVPRSVKMAMEFGVCCLMATVLIGTVSIAWCQKPLVIAFVIATVAWQCFLTYEIPMVDSSSFDWSHEFKDRSNSVFVALCLLLSSLWLCSIIFCDFVNDDLFLIITVEMLVVWFLMRLPSARRWARAYREANKELAGGQKGKNMTGNEK